MGADSHDQHSMLPEEPIDRLVAPLVRFFRVESAGGVVLFICSVVALVLANSPLSESYLGFWRTEVGFSFGDFEFRHSLKHLINDGLMVLFFFVIGLEVKREIVFGQLSDWRNALLPIAAALGGMIAPAALFLAFQWGEAGQRGWGIPMATDIAFVVGCLAILGSRVPHSLRVLLLTLAIADDIGAILVIAIGYTENLQVIWLLGGLIGIVVIHLMARAGIRQFPPYVVLGILVWYSFHESGVHATIAGVILGLMTPSRTYISEGLFRTVLDGARDVFQGGAWESESHRTDKVRHFKRMARETISPLEYLEHSLHSWTSFLVMPVFALANAGVPLSAGALSDKLALAVIAGLVVGKPLGIFLASWICVALRFARLPEGVTWPMLAASGCLAGIGFTMSLFITGLALPEELRQVAKIGVLAASVVSAALGMFFLLVLLKRPRTDEPNQSR